jgi:hypothetical protein
MGVPVNIRQVKIKTITQETPISFQYGDTVIFNGTGEVTSILGKNNNDGSQDLDYLVKAKFVGVSKSDIEITSPKPIQVKPVKERSLSQQLRFQCLAVGESIGENGDELYKKAIEVATEWLFSHEIEVEGYVK